MSNLEKLLENDCYQLVMILEDHGGYSQMVNKWWCHGACPHKDHCTADRCLSYELDNPADIIRQYLKLESK